MNGRSTPNFTKAMIASALRVLSRIPLPIVASIYAAVYFLTYQFLVSMRYGYMQFNRIDDDWILLRVIAAIAPAFLMSRTIEKCTDILVYFFYVFVYVPSMILAGSVVANSALPGSDYVEVTAFMFGSMVLLVLYTRVRYSVKAKKSSFYSPNMLIPLAWFMIGMTLTTIVIYYGFSLPIIDSIYLYDSEDLERRSAKVGFAYYQYFLYWTRGVFAPILLLYYLLRKDYLRSSTVIFFYLIVSSAFATKMDLVTPVLLIAFFVLLFSARRRNRPPKLLIPLLLIAVCLLMIPVLFLSIGNEDLVNHFTGLINMRTFSVQAQNLYKYLDFFSKNDLTYMTHIGFLSAWYPYQYELPSLINFAYGGGNLNSHFWSTEGIAAFGMLGIILSTLIVISVFFIFDSLAKNLDLKVGVFLLSAQGIAFCNVPLSVFLLSGGFIFLGCLLWMFRVEELFRPK